VVREPAIGGPGALQSIDITRISSGPLDTSGLDLETSLMFATPLGLLTTQLDATYVHHYSSAELREDAQVDRVGIASSYGTIPRLHAVATFELDRPFGTLAATVRYVADYRDAYLEPTGRTIHSPPLLDLKLVVEVDQVIDRVTPLEGCKLILGVENLLDEAPPFAEVGMAAGYDPSQGDLRQRFMFLKVTREF
jgi:hypothetical protein